MMGFLSQALKAVDYNTYLIGKWHLGFADWAMTPTRFVVHVELKLNFHL